MIHLCPVDISGGIDVPVVSSAPLATALAESVDVSVAVWSCFYVFHVPFLVSAAVLLYPMEILQCAILVPPIVLLMRAPVNRLVRLAT
jgi:hypothetical protein